MKKKLLSILLTICMLLTLLPGVALAANVPTEVWVGDVNVAAEGYEDGNIAGVTYDKEGNTLTLTSAFTTPEAAPRGYVIFADGDLTVELNNCSFDAGDWGAINTTPQKPGSLQLHLIGGNTITGKHGIQIGGSITVTAELGGSLNITATGSEALRSSGSYLSVASAVTLHAEGGVNEYGKLSALHSRAGTTLGGQEFTGDAQIVDYRNGEITESTPTTGLSVGGTNIPIDRDGTYLEGKASYVAATNTLTLTGAHTASLDWDEGVVHAAGDLNLVLNNCTLTAEGTGYAVYVEGHLKLTLQNANKIQGHDGIWARNSLTVTAEGSGKLTADITKYNCLVSSSGDIHLQSGEFDLTAQDDIALSTNMAITVDSGVTLIARGGFYLEEMSPALSAGDGITIGGALYEGDKQVVRYENNVLTDFDLPSALTVMNQNMLEDNEIEGARYDPYTNTLTLTGEHAVPENKRENVISATGDLNVVLAGCTLDAGSEGMAIAVTDGHLNLVLQNTNNINGFDGIDASGSITVSAEAGGKLISSVEQDCLQSNGDITLQSGDYTLTSQNSNALRAPSAAITVGKDVTLYAKGGATDAGKKTSALWWLNLYADFGDQKYAGVDQIVEYKNGVLKAYTPLTGLTVAGMEIDPETNDTYLEGKASYEAATHTLTLTGEIASGEGENTVFADGDLNLVLNGCNLVVGVGGYAVYMTGRLNLKLQGENSITGDDGIFTNGTITVTAAPGGKLNSDVQYTCLYSLFGDINLQSGNFELIAQMNAALWAGMNITVKNDVVLSAWSSLINSVVKHPALRTDQNVTIGGVLYEGDKQALHYENGALTVFNPPSELVVGEQNMLENNTATGASYDPDTNTLTLTDKLDLHATFEDGAPAVYVEGDLNLVLDGTVNLTLENLAYAVLVAGDLNITTKNGGTLQTNAKIGIEVDDSLRATNLHLVMTGDSPTDIIGGYGAVWLTNCTAEAPVGRLLATDGLTIDGGSSISAGTVSSGEVLVTGNSSLTLTGASTLAEGTTLTVDAGSSLTLEGTTATLSGAGTLAGDGTFAVRHGLKDTDIEEIDAPVYTGSALTPAVTINDREILGKAFTVSTEDYTKDYVYNIDAGEAMVVFTPKMGIHADEVTRPFTIIQSTTAFEGGVKTYKDQTETQKFTYGDTITVRVTPKATGEAAPAPLMRTFAIPTAGQMALYKGGTQISDAVSIGEDGVYTMTINTSDKALDVGNNEITAKYVGDTNMEDAEGTATVTLLPKAISSASVSTEDPSATRKFNGLNTITGVALTLEDIDTDTATAIGTAAGVDVGTHEFTATSVVLDGAHATYYTLSPGVVSGDVTISKADALHIAPPAQIPMKQGVPRAYTFDLSKIALPTNAGTKEYTLGTVSDDNNLFSTEGVAMENGILTVSTGGDGTVDNTATVDVTISSENYADTTVTLTFIVSAKMPVDISGVTVAGKVYNGEPVAMTGTPIAKDGDNTVEIGELTYTWSKANGDALESAPTGAGDYKLTMSVKAEDENYAGALQIPFSITKASITVKAEDKTAYVGDEAPDPTYTVTGLVKDEVLASTPTASYEITPDMTVPGETVITVSGGAVPVGDNYDEIITYLPGKLTVSNRPAPSGGTTGGSTTTETEKNPDGSTTTTVTDKRTGTVTETTKHPNGTTQVVQTQKDGTVIEKLTTPEGTKAEVVKKSDGSMTSTEARKDGTKAESATTAEGMTTATVTVPESKERVTLTIPTPKMPAPGQVAVIVHADGTREVVKTSVATEGGLRITLTGDAKLEIVDNAKDFGDVEQDSWYADSVAFASSRELLEGTGGGSFSPETTMTRSMLMTVLYRFSDAEVSSGGEQWYSDALAWSVEAGLSDGRNPEEDISREQLATILYRFAGSPEAEGAALGDFTDGDGVSPWAADALAWAVECGILQGDGTALHPLETASRAEVAALLQRYVSLEDGL